MFCMVGHKMPIRPGHLIKPNVEKLELNPFYRNLQKLVIQVGMYLVSNLCLETKGSQSESGHKLNAEANSLK